MKISTKGRYGLRILLDLAQHQQGDRPRLIREIAESQQISEKYVSRLVVEMRNAGFVESSRGAKGGYRIVKRPCDISLLDLFEALEGPIAVVDCVAPGEPPCSRDIRCGSRRFWQKLNAEIRLLLSKYSLQTLLDETPNDDGLVETINFASKIGSKLRNSHDR